MAILENFGILGLVLGNLTRRKDHDPWPVGLLRFSNSQGFWFRFCEPHGEIY